MEGVESLPRPPHSPVARSRAMLQGAEKVAGGSLCLPSLMPVSTGREGLTPAADARSPLVLPINIICGKGFGERDGIGQGGSR